MNRLLALHLAFAIVAVGQTTLAAETPASKLGTEIHSKIATSANQNNNRIALTLDLCSGRFDEDLVLFLIRNKIPATIFVTKLWIDKNPYGVAILKANMPLFDIEDHGEKHIPAVVGAGKRIYGILGQPDLIHLRKEVQAGADAIEQAFGVAPRWYRGATAVYDEQALDEITRLGFKTAGFSVNADAGATLGQAAIIERLRRVKGGDVIIAHMNKPPSYTAEGLSIGLLELLKKGLVFVRLDQVELKTVK